MLVAGTLLWLWNTIQGKGGKCPACGHLIKSNRYVCGESGRDSRAACPPTDGAEAQALIIET